MVEKLILHSLAPALVAISCSQNANCTLPQNLRHMWHSLCCVTKLHILVWPSIVPSTRCTSVMIMLFNQISDMPHLSGGWIILAKDKCSLTGMLTNLFTTFERHLWDLFFQLMKYGTNTLHVALIFLFSVDTTLN